MKPFLVWICSLLVFSPFMEGPLLYTAEIPMDISLKSKPATLKIRILDSAGEAILEVKGR